MITGSEFSKALWAKYASGGMEAPNQEMRNELRAPVKMTPTVIEAIGVASPDVEVVRIGEETPDRIIMLGVDQPVTIYSSGTVTAVTGKHAPKVHVTQVTPSVGRIKVDREVFDRVNAKRRALGLSWGEVVAKVEKSLDVTLNALNK